MTNIQRSIGVLVVSTAVLLVSAAGRAQEAQLPWLAAIGCSPERPAIHTIATEADVRGSDGLTYKATTLFHDRQRAVFRSEDADQTVTFGVDGRYIWSFDGSAEQEVGADVEDFVLGHQIHAQLLFFDALQDSLGEPEPRRFDGRECLALSSLGAAPWTVFYGTDGHPLALEKSRSDEPNILFRLGSWRDVDGIRLPHEVSIDDGERQFQYRYSSVTINRGSMADFRAPLTVLTDEQKLMRLHRWIMDDHFFGRTDAMKAMHADTVVVVNAGEVSVFTGSAWDEQIDGMMSTRDYFVYDDRMRPTIRVSRDGTLGWVIVQVSATGVRFGPGGQLAGPLAFDSAWIELYEKINDEWRMTGNVSNFKPGRQ